MLFTDQPLASHTAPALQVIAKGLSPAKRQRIHGIDHPNVADIVSGKPIVRMQVERIRHQPGAFAAAVAVQRIAIIEGLGPV